MSETQPKPLRSSTSGPLKGSISVPGDKSISHRALMLGAVALGRTRIRGLLEGEDVLHTAAALKQMGAESGRDDNGHWWVEGRGTGALNEAPNVMDMGNSGTSTRLLMGLVGSYGFNSLFTGDASLRKRPMARVIDPLSQMGVNFLAREGGKLPITVLGTRDTVPITYTTPVASAQVKSAILLCALNTPGITTVIEKEATRDHSEIMLKHFGADITSEKTKDGLRISLRGYPELKAREVDVPGDPSSAAFVVAAALLAEGSDVTVKNVGLNPLRTGLYETLQEMGADITFENTRLQAGEKTADLRVKSSKLKGVKVPASRAPSMIDEYPILAVLASFASGTTVMEGLAELRVKESDRIAMIASNLEACGVKLSVEGDTLTVTGGKVAGGANIKTAMDHRIAMSFLVMGLGAEKPIAIDDGSFINTSFPKFVDLMNGLGAKISAA
jgi:3-phosphoshikimate 1-carboxyvinyltransferase